MLRFARMLAGGILILAGFGLPGAGAVPAPGKESRTMLQLGARVGQRVELSGRRSRIIAQHLVGAVAGKTAEYFDPDDGGNQIVVHLTGGLEPDRPVLLHGTVLEVRGPAKRSLPPGAAEGETSTKVDESYVEYALDVDRVVVVPEAGEIPGLLERLASDTLTVDAKQAIEERIVAAGLAAVPLLIDHLGDERPTGQETRIRNLAELTNRPAVIDGPEPEAEMVRTPVPLGRRCDAMLHRIVAPRNYLSPFEANFKPRAAGYDGFLFRVKAWPAFFEARRELPLSEIRAGLEPAIDHYYRTGGEERVVE